MHKPTPLNKCGMRLTPATVQHTAIALKSCTTFGDSLTSMKGWCNMIKTGDKFQLGCGAELRVVSTYSCGTLVEIEGEAVVNKMVRVAVLPPPSARSTDRKFMILLTATSYVCTLGGKLSQRWWLFSKKPIPKNSNGERNTMQLPTDAEIEAYEAMTPEEQEQFIARREQAQRYEDEGRGLARKLADMMNGAEEHAVAGFVDELTNRTHRTLQQASFSLMLKCLHTWQAKHTSGDFDLRNEDTVRISAEIVKQLEGRGVRYI